MTIVDLEKIFNKKFAGSYPEVMDMKDEIISVMREASNQSIDLCAVNAEYTYYMYMFKNGIKYIDSETLSIDKGSILKTKNQIK